MDIFTASTRQQCSYRTLSVCQPHEYNVLVSLLLITISRNILSKLTSEVCAEAEAEDDIGGRLERLGELLADFLLWDCGPVRMQNVHDHLTPVEKPVRHIPTGANGHRRLSLDSTERQQRWDMETHLVKSKREYSEYNYGKRMRDYLNWGRGSSWLLKIIRIGRIENGYIHWNDMTTFQLNSIRSLRLLLQSISLECTWTKVWGDHHTLKLYD